jgi:hypothetical protein
VSWFSLEALGALMRRHRADDTTTRAIRRIMRAELIVIDRNHWPLTRMHYDVCLKHG